MTRFSDQPTGTVVQTQVRRETATELAGRFRRRDATIGIVGLGYVGLPLARAIATAGFKVIGFDVDQQKADMLLRGESYIHHLPAELFTRLIADNRFAPTTDYSRIAEVDAVLICVPTPLNRHREPDLTYVEQTTRAIAPRLRPGHLIVLESTTYPGTTRELMQPILEAGGLKSGKDFYLAFSPEREDPGNPEFSTTSIPKVVGADGSDALDVTTALYDQFVSRTVPVSTLDAAEAVKITENIFRAVNIALVNELKIIYGAMGIDIWEVIEAAKSKPFGFMPFYPGPGLGGHCIPIDPFYLTWKARELELPTRFIELAGEINAAMPKFVVGRLVEELSRRFSKSIRGARILMIGLAYKKNVDDVRESPGFKLIELLEGNGATVDFYDPFVPVIPQTREHAPLAGRRGAAFTPQSVASYDAVLIATDHDKVDYATLVKHARLVVDTRNAVARSGIVNADNVCKA
jgi:UDP-N-acetyl-D-glucosamine dehydrogenase